MKAFVKVKILFICTVFVLMSCTDAAVQKEQKPEELCALLDHVSGNQMKITRYRFLLESLSTHGPISTKQVYEYTVAAQESMRKQYGKDEPLLTILENINALLDDKPHLTYEDAIVLYIVVEGRSAPRQN